MDFIEIRQVANLLDAHQDKKGALAISPTIVILYYSIAMLVLVSRLVHVEVEVVVEGVVAVDGVEVVVPVFRRVVVVGGGGLWMW